MTSLSVGCHNDNAEKADGLPDTYGDPTLSRRSSSGCAQSSPDRAEGRIEKLGDPDPRLNRGNRSTLSFRPLREEADSPRNP